MHKSHSVQLTYVLNKSLFWGIMDKTCEFNTTYQECNIQMFVNNKYIIVVIFTKPMFLLTKMFGRTGRTSSWYDFISTKLRPEILVW